MIKALKNFKTAFLIGMFILAGMLAEASPSNTIVVLTERNIVPIYGTIDTGMAFEISLRVSRLRQDSDDRIYFVINSGGGSTVEAQRIVNIINMSDNAEVVILYAGSAAAGISQLVHVPVTMLGSAKLMFHHVSYGLFRNSYTAKELIELGKELKAFEVQYFNAIGRKMKLTYKDFEAKFKQDDNEEWTIYAVEAKKLKAIEHIKEIKCSESAKNLTTNVIYKSLKQLTPLCQIPKEI